MKKLRKDLSLFGLTMVAVGSVIGSGIFLTPSQIASYIPSSGLIILAWMLGGILALTGALTLGELGGMFPKTGGIYVYLREAYGDFIGFLYGWAYFTVIMSGTVAALSIAFATYLGYLFPMSETGKVIEFQNAELEILKEKIAEELGYELIDHRLELYGKKLKKKK